MSEGRASKGKVATVAIWIVTVAEALMMALAGSTKFTGAAGWTEMFVGWGYPAWFSPMTGGAEMAFALLMLVPRFAAWAAIALMLIMIGALVTLVVHDDPLGVTAPIVNMVLLSIVIAGRWKDRWRPAPSKS